MTKPPAQPLIVHVVSHTHWDREWYQPVGRFRQRLIALIDALLDDGVDVGPFLLDGQTIVLDDYLEVRPERRDDLRARLRDGSLEAGPWYVLADELIPSGESLVRNLLAGRESLRRLGATAPAVLYSPDAFGHPAMLPAIAAGFGMPLIVLWRGYGGAAHPRGDIARWRASDGSTALIYHLSPSGYELGASLPVDAHAAGQRWSALRAVLAPRATTAHVLLPNGADHHERQRDRARAVEMLATAARPDDVRLTSLGAFGSALVSAAEEADVPDVTGELRDSYGYTWTLQGTFATRSALKRRAAQAERSLLRNTEPWVALAERARRTNRGALMRAAWRTLLQCQPHDTLCGCCVDAVARAMAARLEDVEMQSAGLREDALFDVIGFDAEATRAAPATRTSAVAICNPAARAREGVAEVEVLAVRDRVHVGPGSGGAPTMPVGESPPAWLIDAGKVPVQRLVTERRHDRLETPQSYPLDEFVESTRALVWAPRIEGYGTRALALSIGDAATASESPDPVRTSGLTISNAAMRIEEDAHGRIRIDFTDGSRSLTSVLAIESMTDAGDLYTPSLRGEPRFAEFTNPRRGLRGPLRATLVSDWRVEFYDELRMLAPRVASGTLTLTLDAGAKFVRVGIDGENGMADHRLRLRVSTDVRNAEVFADAAFGPVRREPIVAPQLAAETPPAIAPLARYVTLATADRGATVYSDGLGEYEAYDGGTIALTLLRAVGELSRNDLPERPGHAGWPASTPEAQQPGHFSGRFALLLHGPRNEGTIAEIERTADDVLHPLAGRTVRSATVIPASTSGATLEGEGLAFSTIKTSDDGEWLVLRCVNLLDREVAGSWLLGVPVREARRSRLDESLGEPVGIQNDRIAFIAPPRAILTFLAR